jgi:hypothetical protein
VHWTAGDWRIGGGGGGGTTRAFGSPQARLVLSIEWAPQAQKEADPPPVADRDQDGIADSRDACPDQVGPPTLNPRTNGCPPSPPPDGDYDK